MISLLAKKRQQSLVILTTQAKRDYVNYISPDLSAQTMSTQNDGQNSGR